MYRVAPDRTENISPYKLTSPDQCSANNVGLMTNPEYVDLIFQSYSYWLASPWVYVDFRNNGIANFSLMIVGEDFVSDLNYTLFDSQPSLDSVGPFIVRPVAELTSKIYKNTSTGAWEFVS